MLHCCKSIHENIIIKTASQRQSCIYIYTHKLLLKSDNSIIIVRKIDRYACYGHYGHLDKEYPVCCVFIRMDSAQTIYWHSIFYSRRSIIEKKHIIYY